MPEGMNEAGVARRLALGNISAIRLHSYFHQVRRRGQSLRQVCVGGDGRVLGGVGGWGALNK